MRYFPIRISFFLLLVLSFPADLKAQNSDLESGLYNVGVGSILGGIGAVINKEPGEKAGKIFLQGLGKGALGGYLVFESKRLVREFARTEDYSYIWPSKLVNAAGVSIIENAAANRKLWERWHLNLGFNRIEVSTTDKVKLKYRIMPFSMLTTLYYSTRGNFSPEKSLKLGNFVFVADDIVMPNGQEAWGAAATNTIILRKDLEGVSTEAHELVHTYQYESFSGINAFLDKPLNQLYESNRHLGFYPKIFHTDFNAILSGGLYSLETWTAKRYHDNFFEEEAYYFTR